MSQDMQNPPVSPTTGQGLSTNEQRPIGAPGTRPAGAPGTRPAGAPGTRPAGAPGALKMSTPGMQSTQTPPMFTQNGTQGVPQTSLPTFTPNVSQGVPPVQSPTFTPNVTQGVPPLQPPTFTPNVSQGVPPLQPPTFNQNVTQGVHPVQPPTFNQNVTQGVPPVQPPMFNQNVTQGVHPVQPPVSPYQQAETLNYGNQFGNGQYNQANNMKQPTEQWQNNMYNQHNYNSYGEQGQAQRFNTENAKQSVNSFFYMMRNLLGIDDADADSSIDYYERDKKIVPEIVDQCEGEIPVKQYHIANFRSRMQGLWAEGRVQVTNKRVIFRASGRSFIGRTVTQQEYIIDEIAGIGISKGVRFSFIEFFLVLLLLCPICGSLANGMTMAMFGYKEFIGYIFLLFFGIAGVAPSFVLRKKLLIKTLTCSVALGAFYGGMRVDDNILFTLCLIVSLVLMLVSLFFFALKASVSISIMSKAGTGTPIGVSSVQHFQLQYAKDVLPAKEMDLANRELGAIISDIQKLGDYGIEKWKA
ncbi:MAG TPA: hypothetical protein VJZ04_06740 [Lachnospiraceae bacterium]|nr:hypothetical protein [Lachnospiraceae bacterium]